MRSSSLSSRMSRGLNKPQQFVAKNYRVPGVGRDRYRPEEVVLEGVRDLSLPVKYATVKDSTGTSWQIGYMDEYAGTDQQPAGPGHHSWQGCVRRPCMATSSSRPWQRHSRDRARSCRIMACPGPAISTRTRRVRCRTCAMSCTSWWSTSSASSRRSISAIRLAARSSWVTP